MDYEQQRLQTLRNLDQFEGIPWLSADRRATVSEVRATLIALEGLLEQPFFSAFTFPEQLRELRQEGLFPRLFLSLENLLHPFVLAAMLEPEDGNDVVVAWIDANFFANDPSLLRDAGGITAGATGESLLRLRRQSILFGAKNLERFLVEAVGDTGNAAEESLLLGEPVNVVQVRSALRAGGGLALQWSPGRPTQTLPVEIAVANGRSFSVVKEMLRASANQVDAARRALFKVTEQRVTRAWQAPDREVPQKTLRALVSAAKLQEFQDQTTNLPLLKDLLARAAAKGMSRLVSELLRGHTVPAAAQALLAGENTALLRAVQSGDRETVDVIVSFAEENTIPVDAFVNDFYPLNAAGMIVNEAIARRLLQFSTTRDPLQFLLAVFAAALSFFENDAPETAWKLLRDFHDQGRRGAASAPEAGDEPQGVGSLPWAKRRVLVEFVSRPDAKFIEEVYRFLFEKVVGFRETAPHARNLFVRAVTVGNATAADVLSRGPYSVSLSPHLNGPGFRIIDTVNGLFDGDLPQTNQFVDIADTTSQKFAEAERAQGEEQRMVVFFAGNDAAPGEWESQRTLLDEAVLFACQNGNAKNLAVTFASVVPDEPWAVRAVRDVLANSALHCKNFAIWKAVALFYFTVFLRVQARSRSGPSPDEGSREEALLADLARDGNVFLKKAVTVSAATGDWAFTVFLLQYVNPATQGYDEAAELAWQALRGSGLSDQQIDRLGKAFDKDELDAVAVLRDFVTARAK